MPVKFSKRRAEIFKKTNGFQDILNFPGFTVPKIALHNKIIDKILAKKDQENSTLLTNHLVKLLQDRIEP